MTGSFRKWMIYSALTLALAVATLLAYANSFHAPFVFDDFNVIVKNNPHLHLKDLSLEAFQTLLTRADGRKRPVALITLALNDYYGGKDTFGYHLVNVAIHLLTGVLLFFLLLAMQRQAPPDAEPDRPRPGFLPSAYTPAAIAFFSALIWMLHPLQTNAVTYVVQRMTSLCALFFVLSLLLYIKGRVLVREGRFVPGVAILAICVLTAFAAVLSKENGAMLPVCILIYEWYFFQDLRPVPLKWGVIGGLLVALVIAWAAWFFLGSNPLDRLLAGYDQWNFTLPMRVLTEYRVIVFYFSLMAFPHPSRLMVDYDYPISHSFFDPPTTLISALAVVMLAVVTIATAKKHRLFSFCLFWFLINLVIESSIIGIEIIYEHRLYLPSMMVFFMAVYLAYHHLRREWAAIIGLLVIAAVLGLWTYQRNQVWASDIAFWKDCAQKSPKDARPLQNLAYCLERNGLHGEAVRYYRASLKLEDHPVTYFNIGVSLSKMKRHAEAVAAYQKAVDRRYNTSAAYAKLAFEQVMTGELDKARRNYQSAIRVNPKNQKAKQELQKLSRFLNKCGPPENCLRLLCDEYPENPELPFKLAAVYGERKNSDAAFFWLEKAVARGFDDLERLNSDAGLENLREDPRFKRLKAGIAAAPPGR